MALYFSSDLQNHTAATGGRRAKEVEKRLGSDRRRRQQWGIQFGGGGWWITMEAATLEEAATGSGGAREAFWPAVGTAEGALASGSEVLGNSGYTLSSPRQYAIFSPSSFDFGVHFVPSAPSFSPNLG